MLENSAGGTNSIGSTFEDLKGIIDLVKGTNSRFGIYWGKIALELGFASILVTHLLLVHPPGIDISDLEGYDLRTEAAYEETWTQFDTIVGFKNLAGIHLNDSRSTLGSKRDLHANLG